MRMNFLEITQTRRSLRTYLPTPVEPEKLEYILECARLAPSWKNLQCWRFIVVEDVERRQALAESEVWEDKDFMMLDAGLAMEHLILAAAEQGLGTCWQGLFSEENVRNTLKVPDDVRVLAMTPLGYAAETKRPRPRKEMREIVFKGTWREKY